MRVCVCAKGTTDVSIIIYAFSITDVFVSSSVFACVSSCVFFSLLDVKLSMSVLSTSIPDVVSSSVCVCVCGGGGGGGGGGGSASLVMYLLPHQCVRYRRLVLVVSISDTSISSCVYLCSQGFCHSFISLLSTPLMCHSFMCVLRGFLVSQFHIFAFSIPVVSFLQCVFVCLCVCVRRCVCMRVCVCATQQAGRSHGTQDLTSASVVLLTNLY